MLGGQNGEEGKVEDEVSGEEDGAQNRKAAESEEEVTPRRRGRLPGNRRLARTGRRGRERSAMQPRTSRRFKSTTEGVGEIEVTLRRSCPRTASQGRLSSFRQRRALKGTCNGEADEQAG